MDYSILGFYSGIPPILGSYQIGMMTMIEQNEALGSRGSRHSGSGQKGLELQNLNSSFHLIFHSPNPTLIGYTPLCYGLP